jgi:hypothetical protein
VTFDQVGRDFDRKRAAANHHLRPSNTQENFPQNDKQQVRFAGHGRIADGWP